MESIHSKLLKIILRITNAKKMWQVTGDKLAKSIEKKQLSRNPGPPKILQRKYNISKKDMNGYSYYVMKPLNTEGEKHILYLHGGGYVYEIVSAHWLFLGNLIDRLNCTVTVPIYPLAPKHQCRDVFDMVLPIYRQIISRTKPEDVVVMGDSAGGGISLALAQLLKEKELPQPGNIVLISPALDMTLSNPGIKEVGKIDPVLAAPSIIDIMKWYARGTDPRHYLVSPIYGSIEGVGKISLFIGTHDILYPDAKKFKNMADEKEIEINYYEYPGMIHCWPLVFFLPEAKKATKQIIEIIM